MMKRTIHDGSVSYSQTLPNPLPGEGKNFRKPTNSQIKKRKAYINNLPKKAMKGE